MSGRVACVLAGVLAIPSAVADSTLVYASNYDLVFAADGESRFQVRSRARVRDGHAIPVEFGGHKVEINVSRTEEERVEIELGVFEKAQGSWYRINVEELSFVTQLETPVEFTWASAGIQLDLALVVSVYRP